MWISWRSFLEDRALSKRYCESHCTTSRQVWVDFWKKHNRSSWLPKLKPVYNPQWNNGITAPARPNTSLSFPHIRGSQCTCLLWAPAISSNPPVIRLSQGWLNPFQSRVLGNQKWYKKEDCFCILIWWFVCGCCCCWQNIVTGCTLVCNVFQCHRH